jgi:ribonuclease HI
MSIVSKSIIDIFCDGASSNNGKVTARAGYGVAVFIDRIPATKYSVKIHQTEAQTNQRAELQALFHALRIVKEKSESITIYTDSMYAIHCVSKWATGWKARGWKKADGKTILHLDIIQPMIILYEEINKQKLVKLQHVRGHQTVQTYEAIGNALADELATDSIAI